MTDDPITKCSACQSSNLEEEWCDDGDEFYWDVRVECQDCGEVDWYATEGDKL